MIKEMHAMWLMALAGIILINFTGCEISHKPQKEYLFEEVISLEGHWKFSIGDNMKWADPDFNDIDWVKIKVPSPWEDEGFHGYNGYAWYRKEFILPDDFEGASLLLHLGYVDDVDETYINGILVGRSGTFPPDYHSAYNAFRKYIVPGNILNYGENLIAVRVFDSQLAGGITSGNIALHINKNEIRPDLNLMGEWKFNTGDNNKWKDKDFNDTEWFNIIVPGYWENQGFRDYDGFAWYRKEFSLPQDMENKKLVLLLGKIDDLDEAYVNGVFIGSTGEIKEDSVEIHFNQEYQAFRGYYIPENIIKSGNNTISVRVYDGWRDGGIYEGPIGIITQENYIKYWKERKKGKGFFD